MDQRGGAMEGATVTVREVSDGSRAHGAARMPMGSSALAALPAGEYEVQVSSGSEQLYEADHACGARDRAVLSVYFRHEAAGTAGKDSRELLVARAHANEGRWEMSAAFPEASRVASSGASWRRLGWRRNGRADSAAVRRRPPDGPQAALAIIKEEPPARCTCAPTSRKRSTSIRRSSPTGTASPASPFRWPIPSPPGAWP